MGWGKKFTTHLELLYIEVDIEVISSEVSGDIGCAVLVENLLQVSGGRRIQAQSIAANIFERTGNTWYLVSHRGSPAIRLNTI